LKDLSTSVETLAQKTEKLIKAYQVSQSQIEAFEQQRLQQANQIATLEGQLNELREENKVLRLASAIKGDDSRVSESKRRISQMIREIDRCIALLND